MPEELLRSRVTGVATKVVVNCPLSLFDLEKSLGRTCRGTPSNSVSPNVDL